MKRLRIENKNTLEYWENEYKKEDRDTQRFKTRAAHDLGGRVDDVLKEIEPNDSVLDIGTGAGNFIRQLRNQRKDFRITICDFSKNAIDYAKDMADDSFVADITCGLNIPDNHYDVVIATELIEHLESPQNAILEMTRIAKKKVIIQCPYKENLTDRIVSGEHLWSFDEEDFNFLKKHGNVKIKREGTVLMIVLNKVI